MVAVGVENIEQGFSLMSIKRFIVYICCIADETKQNIIYYRNLMQFLSNEIEFMQFKLL